jgi:hypothetical protein
VTRNPFEGSGCRYESVPGAGPMMQALLDAIAATRDNGGVLHAKLRAVDVDDLSAFAVALNVSPARLLVPDVQEDEEVRMVPRLAVPGWSAWAWANGRHSLSTEQDDLNDPDVQRRELDFDQERPVWERARESHPLAQATRHLVWAVGRSLAVAPGVARSKSSKTGVKAWLGTVQQSLDGVRREADRLAAEVDDRG